MRILLASLLLVCIYGGDVQQKKLCIGHKHGDCVL